jgi:hypothetical protein
LGDVKKGYTRIRTLASGGERGGVEGFMPVVSAIIYVSVTSSGSTFCEEIDWKKILVSPLIICVEYNTVFDLYS